MSAPEKIWAVTEPNDVSADILGDVYAQQVPEGMVGEPTEYTRTDTIPTLIAQARREALEEAAQIADRAMRGAENAAGKAKLTTAILGHSGRAEFAERIAQEIRALIDKEGDNAHPAGSKRAGE